MATSRSPASGGSGGPDEKDMPPRDRDQHAESAARAQSKAEEAEAAATRPLGGADAGTRDPLTSRGHLEDASEPAVSGGPMGGASAAGGEPGDERRRRVAERAYQKAEQRGFSPGGEDADWFEAEKEIDGPGK